MVLKLQMNEPRRLWGSNRDWLCNTASTTPYYTGCQLPVASKNQFKAFVCTDKERDSVWITRTSVCTLFLYSSLPNLALHFNFYLSLSLYITVPLDGPTLMCEDACIRNTHLVLFVVKTEVCIWNSWYLHGLGAQQQYEPTFTYHYDLKNYRIFLKYNDLWYW